MYSSTRIPVKEENREDIINCISVFCNLFRESCLKTSACVKPVCPGIPLEENRQDIINSLYFGFL